MKDEKEEKVETPPIPPTITTITKEEEMDIDITEDESPLGNTEIEEARERAKKERKKKKQKEISKIIITETARPIIKPTPIPKTKPTIKNGKELAKSGGLKVNLLPYFSILGSALVLLSFFSFFRKKEK